MPRAMMMVILKAMERMTLREKERMMNRDLDGDAEGCDDAWERSRTDILSNLE